MSQYNSLKQSNKLPNQIPLSIDQHRNSIQDRIANLQAKILKRASQSTQLKNEIQSENFNKYLGYNEHNFNSNNLLREQKYQNNSLNYQYPINQLLHVDPMRKSIVSNQRRKTRSPVLTNRNKSPRVQFNKIKQSNLVNLNVNESQTINKRQIKKQTSQNNTKRTQNPFLMSQTVNLKQTSKIKNNNNQRQYQDKLKNLLKQQQLQKQQQINKQFNNLSKTISHISNLRQFNKDYHKYQPLKQLKSQFQQNRQILDKRNQNSQLYQMMKSILIGQQKLEKELIELKNKNKQMDKQQNKQKEKDVQVKIRVKDQTKNQQDKVNKVNNKVKVYTPKKIQVSRSRSKSRSITKSARINKSLSPISFTRSKTKQRQNDNEQNQIRAISAINSLSKRNLRQRSSNSTNYVRNRRQQKNNQFELTLNQAISKQKYNKNQRIIIKPQTITQTYQKIQQVIIRSQKQIKQTSKFNHHNNTSINDYLINRIELQKKTKNNLVKKIYQMCQNKCLYK